MAHPSIPGSIEQFLNCGALSPGIRLLCKFHPLLFFLCTCCVGTHFAKAIFKGPFLSAGPYGRTVCALLRGAAGKRFVDMKEVPFVKRKRIVLVVRHNLTAALVFLRPIKKPSVVAISFLFLFLFLFLIRRSR